MQTDPLLPNIIAIPSLVDGTVVEMTFSRRNLFRAVIIRSFQGLFRIRRDRWDVFDFEIIGKGYWSQDDQGSTLTDTIEIARVLAREKLSETSDGYDDKS
jgi:hypothetical protein